MKVKFKVGDVVVIKETGGIFEVAAIDYGETDEQVLSPKPGIGDGPVNASDCRRATNGEILDSDCWFMLGHDSNAHTQPAQGE